MELFRPYVTAFMAGHDKEGHPVITVRLGKPDPISAETKMQMLLFLMERALQLLPAGEEQLTWVLDFKGFSQTHLDYRFGASLVRHAWLLLLRLRPLLAQRPLPCMCRACKQRSGHCISCKPCTRSAWRTWSSLTHTRSSRCVLSSHGLPSLPLH